MPKTNADAKIRNLVESFTADLTLLVREAALQTVQEALGEPGTPARPARKARRASPKQGQKKPARASLKGGGRRSPEVVHKAAEAVEAYVRTNPGCSVNEIGKEFGLATKDLQLPIRKLVAEGRVKTKGQKRGTRYHPGSGRARKKAGKKKAARKKAGGRRGGKRVASRKRRAKR